MEDIRNLLARAGRRLSLNTYLNRLHLVSIGIAGFALLIVLAWLTLPTFNSIIAWTWAAPVLAGLSAIIAMGLWMRARPTELHVAIAVDDRLELREKISTAMVCRNRDDGFAQAAVDDAIQVARDPKTQERVGRKFPVVLPNRWWVSPAIAGIGAAAVLFIPPFDLFASDAIVLTDAEQKEILKTNEEVDSVIDEAIKAMKADKSKIKIESDAPSSDVESAEERNKLRTPEDVKKDRFKDLKAVERQLRERTEGEQAKALEEMERRLAKLDSQKGNEVGNQLTAALKAGNFKEAKAKLAELQKKLEEGKMDDAQKKAMADQLKKLADQMEQLAKQNDAMKDALAQAGLDPNLANDAQGLKQALQQAQKNGKMTAQQANNMMKQAAAMQQAGQMMQKMGQGMKKMAGQMQQPGQNGAMQQMGQQLSQMEMTQQSMQQMQNQLNKIASQCDKLGQGQGMCNKPGNGLSQAAAMQQWQQQMSRGGGMGQKGQGSGGRASRLESKGGLNADKVSVKMNQGAIIGERYIDSDGIIKGESLQDFIEHVATSTARSNEELEENKISAEYKDAIKSYFGELDAKVKPHVVKVEEDSTTESENEGTDDN